MLFNKRTLVVYTVGVLSSLLWVGLPFYSLGTGLQLTHITALFLGVIFLAGKLFSGNWELIAMARPMSVRTLWICSGIILIIISGLLSSLIAENLYEVIKFEVNYLMGLTIIIIIIGTVRCYNDIQFVLKCLILGGTIVCILTLIGFIVPSIGSVTINQNGRAEGLMLHPNQWGMMLAALVPIAASRLGTDYCCIDRWAVLLLLVVSLALSGSKTNIFIAGASGPVVLIIVSYLRADLVSRVRSLSATLLAVMLAVFVAFILLQQFAPHSLTKLLTAADNPIEYRTILSRQEKWSEALAIAQEKPFFGIGAGNTRMYLDATHAHNAYVDFLLTTGLFGVIALTFFLLSIVNLCWYVLRISRNMGFRLQGQCFGLVFGIISYILSNQLSNSFRGTTLPILWVLIGLLIVHGNIWLNVNSGVSHSNESTSHC